MNNKTVIITIILFLFFIQSTNCQNKIDKNFKKYIEKKFNVELDSSYVITTHTRKDIYNELITENYLSEKKAERVLNTCGWKTNVDIFIDSVYSKDSSGKLNGIFVNFKGDSLGGYELTFYNQGRIDSIDISQGCWGRKEITRYKNGVLHGASETFNSKGSKRTYYNYDMGTPIDTQYMWYDNGNPMRKAIYEDGKIISEKCYEGDGKTEMECDF